MPLTPFKDRFSLVHSSASPGVSVSVPSFGRIEPRLTGSLTATLMPQAFRQREGVSIRNFTQYLKTKKRPIIYAGELDGNDRNTSANRMHEFRVHDYGCLLYTSPSPRDGLLSRMPSSA